MEYFLKKVARVKNTEMLVRVMEGSTDPWLQARNFVTQAILGKKFSKSEGKCALVFAACWIAEQYSKLKEQNEILHNKVECLDELYGSVKEQKEGLEHQINVLNKEVENLKVSEKNAVAMFVSNQLMVVENKKLQVENEQLKESHIAGGKASYCMDQDEICIPKEKCSSSLKVCSVENSKVSGDHKATVPVKKYKVVKCFSCGRLGHIAKYCQFSGREKQKQDNQIKCFACGRSGHIASYCPEHREKCFKTCFGCGKTGHIVRNCYILKSEVRVQPRLHGTKMEGRERENSFSRWVFRQGQNGLRRHSHWVPYNVVKAQKVETPYIKRGEEQSSHVNLF